MSEQNQSNFQALGAGLFGFVAVMAIGGGALMVHSSRQAKSAGKPLPAAAPIDIGAAMPRSALPPPRIQQAERREESPAPLIGVEKEPAGAEASVAGAGASSPESAPAAESTSRLQVTQHLETGGNGSSAKAVVKNTIAAEKPAGKVADKKKALPKRTTAGAGAGAETVASVHYGVTDRSELMGRAAGPVYNVAGGAGSKGGAISTGKVAGNTKAKLTDLQRQLEVAGLPEDQRAKLKKDLEDATKGLPDDIERPAQ